ncbi:hypothetical protein ACFSGI_08880 [Paenibacillus nicotianae]|uniref:Uncharacterized protein n=1 Tax=Paenibacillus nicotianae TaxID=1526551 RepID=A0ABW4UV13_9BACL
MIKEEILDQIEDRIEDLLDEVDIADEDLVREFRRKFNELKSQL